MPFGQSKSRRRFRESGLFKAYKLMSGKSFSSCFNTYITAPAITASIEPANKKYGTLLSPVFCEVTVVVLPVVLFVEVTFVPVVFPPVTVLEVDVSEFDDPELLPEEVLLLPEFEVLLLPVLPFDVTCVV